MLLVYSEQGSNIINFETDKPRHGKPVKFSAKVSWDNDSFKLEEYGATLQPSPQYTEAENYVIRVLENGPLSRSQIIDPADTCTPNQAKTALYKLARKGIIYRANPDISGQGKHAIYALKKDPMDVADTIFCKV